MGQSECLVVNSIKVNFTFLFNCTPAGRASDTMMGPKLVELVQLVGAGLRLACGFIIWGKRAVIVCSGVSVVLCDTLGISSCHIIHCMLFLSSPHL